MVARGEKGCVIRASWGKGSAGPVRTLAVVAHAVINDEAFSASPKPVAGPHVLEKMLQSIPPIVPESSAEEVFALFEGNLEMRAVAIVREGMPIGMIARHEIVDNMARPHRLIHQPYRCHRGHAGHVSHRSRSLGGCRRGQEKIQGNHG
jgi:hypothetical protein